MEKVKKHTNIILSILLVFIIILTLISGVTKFLVTNKSIYFDLLEKSNTYPLVEEVLYNKMNLILGNDISDELKKSIVTEEDIRKEADVVLNCMILNLQTGQTVVPDIDTSIYKRRIADALKSLTGFDAQTDLNKNMTSSSQFRDYDITPINITNVNNKLISKNMINKSNTKSNNSDRLITENVATRAELEAKGRAILKEKGLTEAEARQKAAEKGISEDDVWNYLMKNGYLDEELDIQGENSKTEDDLNASEEGITSTDGVNNNSDLPNSSQENSELQDNSEDTKVSRKKIQQIVTTIIFDKNKSFDEKIEEVSAKLMEEAEKIINAEMEKLNFSKVINSNKFKLAVKITSIFNNSFYWLLGLMLLTISTLLLLNKNQLKKGITLIGQTILISGFSLSLIFGFIYVSKLYSSIEINLNPVYFEPMFLMTAEYFCKLLCIYSIIIFLIGLIINIFMMRKRLTRR